MANNLSALAFGALVAALGLFPALLIDLVSGNAMGPKGNWPSYNKEKEPILYWRRVAKLAILIAVLALMSAILYGVRDFLPPSP